MIIREISATEKILLFLQENNGFAVKKIFAELNITISYHLLKRMKNWGLIDIKRGKVFLLKMENNKQGLDILSFFKILKKYGLTTIDMRILKAKGENPEEIFQQTGILANVVQQRKINICTRLSVGSLKEARREIKRILA